MVERLPVKKMVAGSSPAGGAEFSIRPVARQPAGGNFAGGASLFGAL